MRVCRYFGLIIESTYALVFCAICCTADDPLFVVIREIANVFDYGTAIASYVRRICLLRNHIRNHNFRSSRLYLISNSMDGISI